MYLAQNFCHITYNRSCPNGENLSTASKTRLQYFSFFFFIKNKSSVRDIRSTSQSFSKHSNSTSILSNRRRFVRRTIFFFFNEKKTNVVDYLSFFYFRISCFDYFLIERNFDQTRLYLIEY